MQTIRDDNRVEPVVEPAEARQRSLVVFGNLVTAIIAKLDGLYHDLIVAKDEQLAAKDDLIAELRRRAERAERDLINLGGDEAVAPLHELARLRATNQQQAEELRALWVLVEAMEAMLRERQAYQGDALTPVQAAGSTFAAALPAPTGVPEAPAQPAQDARAVGQEDAAHATVAASDPEAAHATPHATAIADSAAIASDQKAAADATPAAASGWAHRAQVPRRVRQRHPLELVIALTASVMLISIIVIRELWPAVPPAAPARTAPSAPLAPLAGVPLAVKRALASEVGLSAPSDAVALPGGSIAVADTGNHRLVLLDTAGHLARSVGAGRLQQPEALVAVGGALYVLDAARGSIDRYDTAGRFTGQVIQSALLTGGRSMAVDGRGLLYVANPKLDGIVVASRTGHHTRLIVGLRGAGRTRFNAPTAIAVGSRGAVYVLDSGNSRIVALTPAGRFVDQWPAPATDIGRAMRLLSLPDGRLLASDPAGAVLIYSLDSGLPTFLRRLRLPAGQPQPISPLGITRTGAGNILITDTRGNRLLVLATP